MQKFISLLLVLLLILPSASAEEFSPLPDTFTVTYATDTRLLNRDKSFVSKEYVTTAHPDADAAIAAIVDAYDAQYAPQLPAIDSPKRNSRLDINVIHSVTGQSVVSFQVIARTSVRRNPEAVDFTCLTFDMSTGRRLALTDLFPADSAAWDVLAAAVRDTLSGYFPLETADSAALDALCTREALESASFMLGPVCLSLHYYASALYPEHTTLMRVAIPYSALDGMMTDYAARQTDNSMYRFVALTYDDGPTYSKTINLMAALRRGGARATFFLIGDRIAEYDDVVMQQNDENHSLQSHHLKHINSENAKPSRLVSQAGQFNEILSGVTGTQPVMMRPPYGKWRPFVDAGVMLPQIIWDVDTKDWTGRAPKGILTLVKKYTVNGSIILMHDICDDVAESTELALQWLREEGYLCVTVEELFMHTGRPLEGDRSYVNGYPADQRESAE